MIELIAIDLDGTLVGSDLQIHPPEREAIIRAREAGVRIVLATGRGFPVVRPYALDLGLTEPVICYQGGLVRDPVSGQVLYAATIAPALYAEAVQLAQVQHLNFTAYSEDTVYLTAVRPSRAFHDQWFGMPIQQVDDLIADVSRPVLKFLIIAEDEEADQIEQSWKAHFAGRLHIVRSHRWFVEGSPLGVSKGDALARLAAQWGIKPAAVMAIGDNDNDRSMLEWAGLGVAMGDARSDLKSIADYVAPPQAESGVAHVIHKFVLHHC